MIGSTLRRILSVAAFFVAALIAAECLAASADSAAPSSPAAAKRLDEWNVIGPGGGGTHYFPTISPLDPKGVLVRCDMTGEYITADGGDTWRMICLGHRQLFRL